MPFVMNSVPTHLSIFVTDPDSGQPVPRLPLYAEVAVPRILPNPPIDDRLREPLRAAISDVDPMVTDQPSPGWKRRARRC